MILLQSRVALQITLAIFFAILHTAISAIGQEKSIKDYSVEVWDANRGFTPFSISAIVQSPDGYLWLGTDEGLVRFDGVQFTVFSTNNTPGIKHNNISSLCIQSDSSLWIGMNGGGICRLKNNTFTPYTTEQGLPENTILSLAAGHDSVLWVGTASSGLVQMKDETFHRFSHNLSDKGFSIYSVAENQSGILRIGVGSMLGMKFPTIDSVQYYRGTSSLLFSILERRDGSVLLGTLDGVFIFDGKESRPFPPKDIAAVKAARAIIEDHAGNLWFGTEGSGLYRYAEGQMTQLATTVGFPTDRILSIYEDKEENLWIGTRGGGLMRLKYSTIMTLSKADGLNSDQVSVVFQDNDDRLWIGSRDSGVCAVQPGTKVRQYTTHNGLTGNHVRALFEDSHGDLWIGTQTGLDRLVNYSRANVSGRIIPMTFNGNPIISVRALVEDHRGNVWIGSSSDGVFCFARSTSSIISYTGQLQGEYIPVRTMLEDRQGTIWVGTRGGLARIDGDTVVPVKTEDNVATREVFALHEDEQGALWIGTYGEGLFRLKNNRMTRCTKQNGLFDDVVYTILDDGRGYFWMSCNKGIFRVSKQELNDFIDGKISSISSTSFGTADGMKSIECNGGSQPSGWKTRDGKLLFATMKGVAVIDPTRISNASIAPSTIIEEVVVDDSIGGVPDKVTIEPGKRKFEARYTGLSFVLPEKIQFRYKLEGYDDQWVDAGTRRKAYYTNIPPGSYTFKVSARHPEMEWSHQAATLSIVIIPFLWETTWFRGLVLGGALSLVFVFVKRRERRINTEARRTIEIQKQLVELESRALRAQMNPHFIFNSLNSIQESILSEKTETACEYLAKFALLIRMILENSEQTKITLDRELEALRIYVELESLRFDKAFSYVIEVDSSIEPSSYTIPPMLIQPYVENAIWHGLSHKEGERSLRINIQPQESSLLCIVEDNGVGRERAAEIKNPLKKDYESKGMRVTRERLDLMNVQNASNTNVRIVDLYDEQHRPAGTRVEINIPLSP